MAHLCQHGEVSTTDHDIRDTRGACDAPEDHSAAGAPAATAPGAQAWRPAVLSIGPLEVATPVELAPMAGVTNRKLDEQLNSFAKVIDASGMVDRLRLLKSPAEVDYARKAAALSDAIYDAALEQMRKNANEANILAAMMEANFLGDGDFPANEYIIGSGPDALLCRYKSGRRQMYKNDQLTLEWSGVFRHV